MTTTNAHRTGALLRSEEIAAILDVSRSFAYRLLASGQIRTIRLGRSVRVRQEDLDEFLKAHLSGEPRYDSISEIG